MGDLIVGRFLSQPGRRWHPACSADMQPKVRSPVEDSDPATWSGRLAIALGLAEPAMLNEIFKAIDARTSPCPQLFVVGDGPTGAGRAARWATPSLPPPSGAA